MKYVLATISYLIGPAVTATVLTLGYATAVLAEAMPAPSIPALLDQAALARLAADLAYPNSAQRFFEDGHAQFEEEIQRFTTEGNQTEPFLTIKPEVLEQLEQLP